MTPQESSKEYTQTTTHGQSPTQEKSFGDMTADERRAHLDSFDDERPKAKRKPKTSTDEELTALDWTFWALGQPIDSVAAKLVLVAFVQHCDSARTAFVGAEKLAEVLNVGRATVRNGFKILEEQGIIEQIGTVRRAKKWRVN